MTLEDNEKPAGVAVDIENLTPNYPTHLHDPAFWEALGRTVATFGFLEQILGKAILAFTGTKKIPEEKLETELAKWRPTLEGALKDSLGQKIDRYGRAVRENASTNISDLDDLLGKLRKACVLRNVLCHGSWGVPDELGRSRPFFVDKKLRVFETAVDVAHLQQVQRHVAELSVVVVSTVTSMGWQFPGSHGPGKPIVSSARR